jgi:hypothetical protein
VVLVLNSQQKIQVFRSFGVDMRFILDVFKAGMTYESYPNEDCEKGYAHSIQIGVFERQ